MQSHIEVWKQVKGVALVLEEDAVLDSKSLHRLQDQLANMKEF
jgi:GR25 family glycosyltransferase involved in LPS biosynthesis